MPADKELIKKWEHIFYQFFDTNKNKVIDWGDFELLFDKVKELRGENSKEYIIVSEAMRMVWKGLLHEVKGIDITSTEDLETEITVNEWNKLWEKYNPRHLQIWQWEYLKYMFFLLDSNGDKVIDKEEYGIVLGMFGIKKEDAAKSYDKIIPHTPNKKFDYGAFVKLWNEYFTNKDPKCPANAMFGPY